MFTVGLRFDEDAVVVDSYSRAVELANQIKGSVYDCHWDGSAVVCNEQIYYGGVRIRVIDGDMPFDRWDPWKNCHVHATGREFYDPYICEAWLVEYEDDLTVDLPCTE